MPEDSVEKSAASGFGILWRGKTDLFRGSRNAPVMNARLDIEFRDALVYITDTTKTESGNSGIYKGGDCR